MRKGGTQIFLIVDFMRITGPDTNIRLDDDGVIDQGRKRQGIL